MDRRKEEGGRWKVGRWKVRLGYWVWHCGSWTVDRRTRSMNGGSGIQLERWETGPIK